MELTFPFRNITLNNLLKFYDEEKVRSYISAVEDYEEFNETFFAKDVELYKDFIPSFDNEILQICETSNQGTIDYLFEQLLGDINLITETFTKEELLSRIEEWNDIELQRFEESISSKVEEFHRHPNRKLKHLEEYQPILPEYYLISTPAAGKSKTKAINHNFYCIEETPRLINEAVADVYLSLVTDLAQLYIGTASQHGHKWQKGEVKTKGNTLSIKPVIFFEGAIDVDYVRKAAILLNEVELINSVDLRQRGSSSNLDKLWNTLIADSWETFIQRKIMIYDCDTGRPDEDFGYFHRRTLAQIENYPIKRGIENLFPMATIERAIAYKRAFIDYKFTNGFQRGEKISLEEYAVNKDEKRNFCDWLCENGTAEDFQEFTRVFQIIRSLTAI